MKCFNCENDSKYKCPTCREGYCSVTCSKVHKGICVGDSLPKVTEQVVQSDNCGDDIKNDSNSNTEVVEPQQATEPENQGSKFEILSKSQKLKEMIWNDPILQNYIQTINSAEDPIIFLDQLKENARFVEFANLVKDLLSAK